MIGSSASGLTLQALCDLEAVHRGHPAIEQHELIRRAASFGVLPFAQRAFAAVGFDHRGAAARENLSEDQAVGGVVVHHQHPQVLQRDRAAGLPSGSERIALRIAR